ncbi:glycoside hydrolase family 4 [candidate division MSBL1 archaeon SCGC-AAA259E19]|uniref:Glycoside hydrolase family 4 n=1 Tax=candidate division MSBL1 archaeon SCGC-AAA259E19 TaxID=1698264 RepID=A0A133UIR9_9EURY|nr:glycoside hydrolase family 4 [candidate division MSBL1 archaeon SCGC-AAA259E19]
MKRNSKKLKIGYIGGGSRGWAHTFINDLAQCEDLSGEVFLYDIDYEAAKRNEKFGNWVQSLNEAVGSWEYRAVKERKKALDDADFVILSIQPGPIEHMAKDIDIPQKYGIYDTVCDTVGPGGTVRAMRTIPIYRDFARAIRKHCPDAWTINYTNPMTVCTRTLYEEFPRIKAFGCCHEVFGTQSFLASLVRKYWDVEEEPSRDEIDVNVKGINHFTWIDRAEWRGRDLFPLLDRHVTEEGVVREFETEEMKEESYFVDNFQVTYELYKRFGILPAAGDRHLVEFVPWFLEDVDDPESLHRWGIRLTPNEYRLERWREAPKKFHKQMEGEEEFEFIDSGEEGIDQMKALLGLGDMKTNVNLPNQGQMPEMPEGAVVETNAYFSQNQISPVTAGKLPRQVRNMILTHVYNQETLVEAGFKGDVDLAFQAFLNDPLVNLDTERARELFEEMVRETQDFLDDWNLKDSETLK